MFALFRKGSKLDLVALVISITLFVQLLMTKRLWVTADRLIPTVPVLKKFPFELSSNFDYLTIGSGFFLLLLIIIMRSKRYYLNLLFMWAALAVLMDINRLQVWFYLFMLMLWVMGFQSKQAEKASAMLGTLRFIIIATYFWSGVHKLNIHFIDYTFPWLMSAFPFTNFLGEIRYLGFVPGLVEILVGVGLLFPKYWHRTFFLAAGFHVVILLLLGPLGLSWNSVVWPWNIAMVALLYILFPINTVLPPSFRDQVSSVRRFMPFYMIVLLLGILPFLNIFNLWDAPISMTMYSGTTDEAEFYYEGVDATCFPDWAENDYEETKQKGDSSREIALNKWSTEELNVPFYARKLIFKKMGRELCNCLSKPESGGIRIISIAGRFNSNLNTQELPCKQLKNKWFKE